MNAQNLKSALTKVGPRGMGKWINNHPGFHMLCGGKRASLVPARKDGEYRVDGTRILVSIAVKADKSTGTATQTVTLKNRGKEPSAPISELHAFRVSLAAMSKHAPRACGFGGGVTHGFYPPRAYKRELVNFGEGRTWTPQKGKFNRWWTSKGRFELSSGPNGRSSNPELPVMMISWQTPKGEMGLWAALEWSGKWLMEFGHTSQWNFLFNGGPTVKNMVLDPGESVTLPTMHIGTFWGGFDNATNSIRHYVATGILPDVEGQRPWPYASYNTWFGLHESINDEILRKQADRAAELGLEYFIVDAAWYPATGARFWTGVGNWNKANPEKFPNGLEPIAEYVKAKGMRFGLWFEPERAYNGSYWLERHPEWFVDVGNASPHFDLGQKAAQDGCIEMMSDWIERLDIRWLRWDNNQPCGLIWDKMDPTGKSQFAYMQGLYRVMGELIKRHPNLMIDNCASGGQRVDFGTLRNCGTMVPSDHGEDPHICRMMQIQGARVFPGNLMNSSIYVGEESANKVASTSLAFVSRMAGAITICGHVATWKKKQVGIARACLDGFKRYRHLLMQDFHRLTHEPHTDKKWDVVEFLDADSKEAVILGYRVRGRIAKKTVRPTGLNPDSQYEIVDPFAGKILGKRSGRAIMKGGLTLSIAPESGIARHLVPVGRGPGSKRVRPLKKMGKK